MTELKIDSEDFAQEMTLVFPEGTNEDSVISRIRPGSIITGNSEFVVCARPGAMSFVERVFQVEIVSSSPLTLRVMTNREDFLKCFNGLQLSSETVNADQTKLLLEAGAEAMYGEARRNKLQAANVAWTTPTFMQNVEPGSTITVTWRASDVPASTVKLALMRSKPMAIDSQLASMGNVPNTGSYSWTFSSTLERSILPVYFLLDWGSDTAESPHFMVPIAQSTSFNWDNNVLINEGCSTLCGTVPSSCNGANLWSSSCLLDEARKKICGFCSYGTAAIKVTCGQCNANARLAVSSFDLSSNVVGIPTKVRVSTTGSVTANLDLSAAFDLRTGTIPTVTRALISNGPIAGISIGVFGVSLDLGLFWDLNLKFSGNVNATGNFRAGARGSLDYKVDYVYDVNNQNQSPSTNGITSKFEILSQDVNVDAAMDIKIGLIPGLKFKIGDLVTVSVSAGPSALIKTEFRYPPFPAMLTNYAPFPNTLKTIGDCSTSHLMHLAVGGAIESPGLQVVVKIPTVYDNTFNVPIPGFGPIGIVSGCLLPRAFSESRPITFTLNFALPNLDPLLQSVLQARAVKELAALLNISPFRLQILNVDPISSSQVKVKIDVLEPSAGSKEPSVDQLISEANSIQSPLVASVDTSEAGSSKSSLPADKGVIAAVVIGLLVSIPVLAFAIFSAIKAKSAAAAGAAGGAASPTQLA